MKRLSEHVHFTDIVLFSKRHKQYSNTMMSEVNKIWHQLLQLSTVKYKSKKTFKRRSYLYIKLYLVDVLVIQNLLICTWDTWIDCLIFTDINLTYHCYDSVKLIRISSKMKVKIRECLYTQWMKQEEIAVRRILFIGWIRHGHLNEGAEASIHVHSLVWHPLNAQWWTLITDVTITYCQNKYMYVKTKSNDKTGKQHETMPDAVA